MDRRRNHMGNRSLASRVFAAAVAVALAAVAAGCSGDDYYCNSTGCFYCDGVGCRAVTPPTRATCQGNYQCTSAQVCTSLGCTTTCAADADCSQGWICHGATATVRGECLSPTETAPTPHPGTCTTDADCPSGTVCSAAGQCAVPTSVCQFNSQCGAGRVCINQQCSAACSASSPCPTGQTCANSVCINHPAGQCTSNSQCASGQQCANSTCFDTCTANSQCATGLYCADGGLCVPDTRRRPFCTSDAQCTSPSVCLDGVCRRPCTTSQECVLTDVSYRNCAPISYLMTPQNYCLTDHEYRPTCARATDCAAGQACVDGVCQTG